MILYRQERRVSFNVNQGLRLKSCHYFRCSHHVSSQSAINSFLRYALDVGKLSITQGCGKCSRLEENFLNNFCKHFEQVKRTWYFNFELSLRLWFTIRDSWNAQASSRKDNRLSIPINVVKCSLIQIKTRQKSRKSGEKKNRYLRIRPSRNAEVTLHIHPPKLDLTYSQSWAYQLQLQHLINKCFKRLLETQQERKGNKRQN